MKCGRFHATLPPLTFTIRHVRVEAGSTIYICLPRLVDQLISRFSIWRYDDRHTRLQQSGRKRHRCTMRIRRKQRRHAFAAK